jgi:hypothetical protein
MVARCDRWRLSLHFTVFLVEQIELERERRGKRERQEDRKKMESETRKRNVFARKNKRSEITSPFHSFASHYLQQQ